MDFSGFPSRYPGSGNPLGSPTHEQFSMTDLSPQEEKSLDLFDGVMSRNLGLDVVVVLTKTDTMSQLEAEQGLSDQHFDFIQQAVRKFCLIYGASLFFTSVKEEERGINVKIISPMAAQFYHRNEIVRKIHASL